jgi:anti-repressor protein
MLIRKIKGGNESLPPSGNQVTIIINESGLYSLIISSKMPNAKKFKHWVTSEVLPAIRKHGAYMTDRKAYDITRDQSGNGTVRKYDDCFLTIDTALS